MISKMLNSSPAVINYRFNKLIDDGVIKRFTLHVDPNAYGMVKSYIAFEDKENFEGEVISKFRCVEWLSVYQIAGRNREELEEKVNKMIKRLGDPLLKYYPEQRTIKLSNLDKKIIELLRRDPRMSISDMSKILNYPSRTITRHLRYLKDRRIIMVLPILDISKSNIIIFSIFTVNPKAISEALHEYKIWEFVDGKAGIIVCSSENVDKTKKVIRLARVYDSKSDVMIIYDYDFYS
jgi:DNA-binding Lrp family transcriptional regulator